MPGLIDAVKTAVKDVTCFGASGADWVVGLLVDGGLPAEGILTEIQNFRGTTCNNNPSNIPDSVGESPGFSGGQCPSLYDNDVTVTYSRIGNPSQVFQATGQATGPIFSYDVVVTDLGGGSERVQVFAVTGSGNVLIGQSNVGSDIAIISTVIVDPSPVGGAPNNCGDPPTQLPQPISEHDDTIDVDYTDEDDNPVSLPNLPIRFFSPCINLDGVRIPFEITLPWGQKICGKIGFRPDLVNILEPAIDIDICPSVKEGYEDVNPDLSTFFEVSAPIGSGSQFPESSLDGTPPESFDPETTNPILGVTVASSLDGVSDYPQTPLLEMPGEDFPVPIIPRIGWVRFRGVAVTEVTSAQSFTERIDLEQVNQLVTCPWPHGAAEAEVHWEYPWSGTFRELRRKSCCDACASSDPRDGLPVVDRCRVD